MDIRCRHCGQATDLNELELYADAFAEAGCAALDAMHDGASVEEAKRVAPCCNEHYDPELQEMDQALYDLLGSDYDGIASSMEEL